MASNGRRRTRKTATQLTDDIPRTSAGLRDFLFTAMESLARGDITNQQAQALANLADRINKSARHDLDAARFLADQKSRTEAGVDMIEAKPVALVPTDASRH